MDRDDCLAIHEMMLAQHGGLPGLRDEGLLASALAKPRHRYAYTSTSLPALAASYAAGVILDHPFLDGNKPTGFMLAATFLATNGIELTAAEESVVQQTIALASGAIKEAEYASWLKQNVRRFRPETSPRRR